MTEPVRPKRFPARLPALMERHAGDAGRDFLRPQRQLHEAVQDARNAHMPTGLGLDSASVRRRMVERLRADGVSCAPVLAAMARVERHRFVDSALVAQAYEDTSLPIGLGQTISKPSVVARMLEWLFLGERAQSLGHLGRVLEVGTGCGYQTAVLAPMATQVVSMERLLGLHAMAVRHLQSLGGHEHCVLLHGDGMLGNAALGPFDSIISAAGGDDIPQEWLMQMAVGGRLVAPVSQTMGSAGKPGQVLMVIDRLAQGWRRTVGETVQFVPLKSGLA